MLFGVFNMISLTVAAQQPAAPAWKEETDKLRFLVGDWTYSEKYEKSRMLPNGGEGSGESTGRLGPAGAHVMLDVSGTAPGGPVQAWQVFTWDARTKTFKCFDFSGAGPGTLESSGRWEANQLVFEATVEAAPGVRVIFRRVYKDIQPDTFTIELFSGREGEPLELFDTVKVKRKK
jgi:hypothetical protein